MFSRNFVQFIIHIKLIKLTFLKLKILGVVMFGFGTKTIKTVEKELLKLPNKQIIHFAWLCGMRVLPFLGAEGNFDYWEPKIREYHLWSVFRALDFTAVAANVHASIYFSDTFRNLAISASHAVPAFGHSTIDVYTKRMNYVSILRQAKMVGDLPPIYDVYSAAALFSPISVNPFDEFYTADAIYDAREGDAIYAAATVESLYYSTLVTINVKAAVETAIFADIASYPQKYKGFNMIPIMLDDIERLKSGYNTGFLHNTLVYGEVWTKFQKALSGANSYWGRLYERLFAKGLSLDDEEIKKLRIRLNLPNEIVGKGASDVAKYIERVESQILSEM